MKRFVILFVTLMILLMNVSWAEGDIDLSRLSIRELQQLIVDVETQLKLADEAMIQSAITALIDHWENEIYDVYNRGSSDGYLEILAVQATYIKEAAAVQEQASYFSNMYCVLDFVLLSDYLSSAPYYFDANTDNSVVVYRDGSVEVKKPLLSFII